MNIQRTITLIVLLLALSPGEFARSQDKTVHSNYPGTIRYHSVGATVDGGDLSITPTTINFGSVRLGDSANAAITFTNTGSTGLLFSLGPMPQGFKFLVFPSELAPGGSFIGTIQFKPTNYGLRSAAIAFYDTTQNPPIVIELRGICADSVSASINPNTIVFPTTPVNGTRDSLFTVFNAGTDTLRTLNWFSTNPSFECRVAALVPPATYTVDTIVFHPQSKGIQEGFLVFCFNSSALRDTVLLRGWCLDTVNVTFSSHSITFPRTRVGSRSDTTLRIVNSGPDTLRIFNSTTTSGSFAFQSSRLVPPGAFVDDSVAFVPGSLGTHEGSIIMELNTTTERDTILLTGFARGIPRVNVPSSVVDVGTCTYNDSLEAVFTITNTGSDTLIINRIASSSPEFVLSSTPVVLPQDSCVQERVKFVPKGSGTRSSTILIYSNAPTSPDTIPIQGAAIWQRWSVLSTPFGRAQNLRIDRWGNYYAIGDLGVLYKSSDLGSTWKAMIFAESGIDYVNSLEIAPDGTLFAAAHYGVVRSTDQANSWLYRNDGIFIPMIRSVYVSPKGTVYASTSDTSGYGGVFRSTNDGDFWNHLSLGPLPSPVNAILETENGSIYVGLPKDGLKCSRDSGATWTTVFPDPNGLYIWLLGSYGNDTLYVGTNMSGLLRTTNAGASWDTVTKGFVGSHISALAVGPDGDVYVATYEGDIARSTDCGDTWSHLPTGLAGRIITFFSFGPDGNVFARASEGTILKNTFLSTSVPLPRQLNRNAPSNYSLDHNYPNPFNPTTTISFSLPEATHVELIVYTLTGKEVERLVNRQLQPGRYSVKWNPVGLPSGAYFARLRTERYHATRKLILLK